MSSDSRSLAELQRAMAAAVLMPLTSDDAMQTTSAEGGDMSEAAAAFIAPNSRLTAFERLEIYNRQYWFRVLGALAEDFPALRAVVGERGFATLSVAYLNAHPSRSFTLRNLGSKLPAWLEQHPDRGGRRWRLALDVARIEWAYVEAFDSADRPPLTLDQIATLDGASRLALQPHLQLLALEYPADELVLHMHDRQKRDASEAGVREDEQQPAATLPRIRRRTTWLAVHRVDLSVYYRRLEREEFLILDAIRRGEPLAAALPAGEGTGMRKSGELQRVQAWFSTWAELGWICAPELELLAPV